MPRGEKGFKKGQSGNPGGRPKGVFALAAEADKHSPEAFKFILDVMRNPEVEMGERIKAAIHILDRAHGKPRQATELTGPGGAELKVNLILALKDDGGTKS